MPYIESESKARIRKIRNTTEPVFDGITRKVNSYDVSENDFHWLLEQAESLHDNNKPRTLAEWHEDDGDCLWWFFPIVEPPYCGTPLDEHFPDYVTHFTKFSMPE